MREEKNIMSGISEGLSNRILVIGVILDLRRKD